MAVITEELANMRKSCLQCVTKHLGKAFINNMEFRLGYPDFMLLVIGNLSEAEDEAIQKYPLLAKEIRKYRIRLQKNEMYEIPYFKLYRKVKLLHLDESSVKKINLNKLLKNK